eukprot:5746752-Pyramimonas_sp.AAC.1
MDNLAIYAASVLVAIEYLHKKDAERAARVSQSVSQSDSQTVRQSDRQSVSQSDCQKVGAGQATRTP